MRKYALTLLAIVMLTSCSQDPRVRKYEQIVKDSDQIRFLVYKDNDFQVIRDVTDKKELETLKNILVSDIQLEKPIKFFPNKKFEFIKSNQPIAHIMILDDGSDPFAVVKIDGQEDFAFRLTYRIGMYPN
jgi:uncharacterized protein YcfL